MKEELTPLQVNKFQMKMMPAKSGDHGRAMMRKHADPQSFDEPHDPEETFKKRQEMTNLEPHID